MDATLEWVKFGIAMLILIGGFIGGAARIGYVVSSLISTLKAEFNALLALKEAEFDSKIGKVWERFDTHKKNCNEEFIRKEVCASIHSGATQAFNDISRRADETNRRLESTEKKLDTLLVHLLEDRRQYEHSRPNA